MSTRQASRTDEATGVREVAGFFGPEAVKMFGFTHFPTSRPKACVVICSPLYAEFIKNYRREVLIARRLAELGLATHRFHYRGLGNSEGDSSATTYDTMLDDAIAAAEHVVGETGVDKLAFFGSRVGATVAAAAASRFDHAPLVLWDPVLDPAQYVRDVFRSARMRALRSRDRESDLGDGMLERLEREGSVQVLGYTITRNLYESTSGRMLEHELGTSPRPIQIVRLGREPRQDRSLSALTVRLRSMEFAVEDRTIGQREAWWFTGGSDIATETLAEASDVTIDWLAASTSDPGVGG